MLVDDHQHLHTAMKNFKVNILIPLFIAFTVCTSGLKGHCQIPCGIYGDETRFTLMLEDVETIRKSIAEILKESEAEPTDYNQLVRWVNNKENHADKIKTIAAEYFLAQRIKEGDDNYHKKLELLHGIIVYAMKTKQSLDMDNVATLEAKINAFKELYLDHTHTH
jgi:nickel superoxide dismutase